MPDDFYKAINADVIRNKEIQKKTGISPAADKQAMLSGKPHSGRYIPSKRGWKDGWKIVITREVMHDYEGMKKPVPRFYQLTYRDFDTDTYHYYPFGLSLLVALKRWIWFKSYHWLQSLRSDQEYKARAKERQTQEIKEAYDKGFTAGREFEFRTISIDLTVVQMRKALDVEKDFPFAAPEVQLEHFKNRLRI